MHLSRTWKAPGLEAKTTSKSSLLCRVNDLSTNTAVRSMQPPKGTSMVERRAPVACIDVASEASSLTVRSGSDSR